jgi:hypothetical protein
MSIYGKRSATSPRENMSKKPQAPVNMVETRHETDINTIVRLELDTINEKPFFGQVSDEEILYLWVTVFGRKREELFGTTSTKTLTRNVRITYKLKAPINLKDLHDGPVFKYEKYLDDGSVEIIIGKILGYDAIKPVELGELAKISVKTNFRVEPSGILSWLKLYGTTTSTSGFAINPSTGLKTDIFEAEVMLKRHIQEYLPIFGQKCQISYAGMPKMCNRCYLVGHLRRDCKNKKTDWIEYVISLLKEGLDPELIGSWKNAVSRYENTSKNPQDEA